MHFKYHATLGILGEAVCYAANIPSNGVFLLFSVAPDLPLLRNELRIRRQGQSFDENSVPDISYNLYMLFHSSLITLLLLMLSPVAAFAHFLHTFSDWFTHTGRFATKPLFPINRYQVKFGRNVLK